MTALRSLALALLASGCSVLAATREPTAETGAACGNFVDDDQDGLLDCEDPGCDGLCPEEELDACLDGRDNDGDGRLDGADARCWHVVPPSVAQCATVHGSVLEPPIGDGERVWRGIADTVPDPRGGGGSVLVGRGETFRVAPVASSTGALDGLRLIVSLRVSQDVETTIDLLPAGELGDATTSSGFTRFVRLTLGARIELTSDQGTNIGILPPPDLAMPTWVDVEMTITGRTVTASMAIGGPLRPIGMLDLPSGMTDPIALDVLVQSGGATPEVPMLERLRLERLDLPACGRDEVVPQMREDGYDLVLDVVRGGAGGDLGCAISTADGVGRPYTAHGDGAWQPAPFPITDGRLLGATFAWDPARGAFLGITTRGNDLEDPREISGLDRIESADCVDWRIAPMELPEPPSDLMLLGRGMSYEVQPDGAHVLRMLAARPPEVAIVTFRSETGEPGTFERFGDPEGTGPGASDVVARAGQLGLEPVGPIDHVLLATADEGLIALTPRGTSGRFETLPEPLRLPSDVPGTFDRGRLIGPPQMLLPDGALGGLIFHGGTSFGNCVGCLTSGSASFALGAGP